MRKSADKVVCLIDSPQSKTVRSKQTRDLTAAQMRPDTVKFTNVFLMILSELQSELLILIRFETEGNTLIRGASSPLLDLITDCFSKNSECKVYGSHKNYSLIQIIKFVTECLEILKKSIYKQARVWKYLSKSNPSPTDAIIAKKMLKFIMRNVQDELNVSKTILDLVDSDVNSQAFKFMYGLLKHFVERSALLLRIDNSLSIRNSSNLKSNEYLNKNSHHTHSENCGLDNFSERLDRLLETWGGIADPSRRSQVQGVVVDCYHCLTRYKKQDNLLKTVSQFTEEMKNKLISHVNSYHQDSRNQCLHRMNSTNSRNDVRSGQVSMIESSTNSNSCQIRNCPLQKCFYCVSLSKSHDGYDEIPGNTTLPHNIPHFTEHRIHRNVASHLRYRKVLRRGGKKHNEQLQKNSDVRYSCKNSHYQKCSRKISNLNHLPLERSTPSKASCDRKSCDKTSCYNLSQTLNSYRMQPVYRKEIEKKQNTASSQKPHIQKKLTEGPEPTFNQEQKKVGRDHTKMTSRNDGSGNESKEEATIGNFGLTEIPLQESSSWGAQRRCKSKTTRKTSTLLQKTNVSMTPKPLAAYSEDSARKNVPLKSDEKAGSKIPSCRQSTEIRENDDEAVAQGHGVKAIEMHEKLESGIVEYLLGKEVQEKTAGTPKSIPTDNFICTTAISKEYHSEHHFRLTCSCFHKKQAKKSCCRGACSCVTTSFDASSVRFSLCQCSQASNMHNLSNRPTYQFFVNHAPVSCDCPGNLQGTAVCKDLSASSSNPCMQNVNTQTSQKNLTKSAEGISKGALSKTQLRIERSDSPSNNSPISSKKCTEVSSCWHPGIIEEIFHDFDEKYSKVIKELKCLIKEGYVPLRNNASKPPKGPLSYRPLQVKMQPYNCKIPGEFSLGEECKPRNLLKGTEKSKDPAHTNLQLEIESLKQMVKDTNFEECSCCKCESIRKEKVPSVKSPSCQEPLSCEVQACQTHAKPLSSDTTQATRDSHRMYPIEHEPSSYQREIGYDNVTSSDFTLSKPTDASVIEVPSIQVKTDGKISPMSAKNVVPDEQLTTTDVGLPYKTSSVNSSHQVPQRGIFKGTLKTSDSNSKLEQEQPRMLEEMVEGSSLLVNQSHSIPSESSHKSLASIQQNVTQDPGMSSHSQGRISSLPPTTSLQRSSIPDQQQNKNNTIVTVSNTVTPPRGTLGQKNERMGATSETSRVDKATSKAQFVASIESPQLLSDSKSPTSSKKQDQPISEGWDQVQPEPELSRKSPFGLVEDAEYRALYSSREKFSKNLERVYPSAEEGLKKGSKDQPGRDDRQGEFGGNAQGTPHGQNVEPGGLIDRDGTVGGLRGAKGSNPGLYGRDNKRGVTPDGNCEAGSYSQRVRPRQRSIDSKPGGFPNRDNIKPNCEGQNPTKGKDTSDADEGTCGGDSTSCSSSKTSSESQAIMDIMPCSFYSDTSIQSSRSEVTNENSRGTKLCMMIIHPQTGISTEDIVKTMVAPNNASKLCKPSKNKNILDYDDVDTSYFKSESWHGSQAQDCIINQLGSNPISSGLEKREPSSTRILKNYRNIKIDDNRRLRNTGFPVTANKINITTTMSEKIRERSRNGRDSRSRENRKTSDKEVQVTKWNAKVQTAGPRKFNRTDITRDVEDQLAKHLGLERTIEESKRQTQKRTARERSVPDCKDCKRKVITISRK